MIRSYCAWLKINASDWISDYRPGFGMLISDADLLRAAEFHGVLWRNSS